MKTPEEIANLANLWCEDSRDLAKQQKELAGLIRTYGDARAEEMRERIASEMSDELAEEIRKTPLDKPE